MQSSVDDKYFRKPDKKQCVDCGIALVLFFLALGLYTGKKSFFLVAFLVQLVIAVWPWLILPVAFLWFGLSKITGRLMSVILLTLIFFLILTPVGVVRKLIGKDRLMLRSFKKDRSSAFTDRKHIFQKAELDHPY